MEVELAQALIWKDSLGGNFPRKKAWAFFVPVYGISDPVRPAIEVQVFIGAGRFSGVRRPGEKVARSRKKFAMDRLFEAPGRTVVGGRQ